MSNNEIDKDVVKTLPKEVREDLNADPITGEPGSHPAGTGIGGASGAVIGAAVGSVAGPLGTIVGGAIGAVVGGGAGKAVAELADPTLEEAYWREVYSQNPITGYEYERDYYPAYRVGYESRNYYPVDARFEDHENDLEAKWHEIKGESRLKWEEAKISARQAWDRFNR
ncbi:MULTISPECIES: glycine zipper family protein [unclassified Acinetobacter]|uniref:glycine zipper family protein n=1 Tax=unclassified Acinetobacter TaxID=196816 RepID=UPI0035B6ADA6